MELIDHRCPRCGGELSKQSDTQWRCVYCGCSFDDATATKNTQTMHEMFDEAKQETINNLRRNLFDAVNAEYISSFDIKNTCTELKKYLPDDFRANFYDIACGHNVQALTAAIRKIDVDEHYDDIEYIIKFLIKSLQPGFLFELNNLIERAYKGKDLRLFEKYATDISVQAEKVQLGVYETKLPREVFVAYSSKDMDKVSELVETLEAQGMKCFVAARNLRHGKGAVENYDKAIKEAIDHCKSIVFVSTPNSRSLSCDALEIELPYIRSRDIENAPSEYRNNYTSIPHRYKKPRVEYRVEDSKKPNAADVITKEFFDGYEWVLSPDEVAVRILQQLISVPQETHTVSTPQPAEKPKKYCTKCGNETEKNQNFCPECGGNNFVDDLSAFIKMKNQKELEERTRFEEEQKKAAEKAAREIAQAKAQAEADKAKAVEQAKKQSQSTYSTYSSSSSSSYSKPKKSKGAIIGISIAVFIGLAIIVNIIAAIADANINPTPDENNSVNIDGSFTEIVDPGDGSQVGVWGGASYRLTPDGVLTASGTGALPSRSELDELTFEYPIVEIVVEDGITLVGNELFKDLTSLKTVTLSGTVSKIEANAFAGSSVETINASGLTFVGENAFDGCAHLKTVSAERLEVVSSNAFRNCKLLSDITAPTLTEIGAGAFSGCQAFTTFTVPSSVTSIGEGAFGGCSSLTSITLPFVGKNKTATGYEGLFGYVFGSDGYEGATTVTQYFSDNRYYDDPTIFFPSSLKNVKITDASRLSYGAFNNCSFLKGIELNSSISHVGNYCFENCSGITELSLPNIDAISDYMLSGCTALESFEIGDSVEEIGAHAFSECNALSRINSENDGEFIINKTVKSIHEGAFGGCTSLTSITLPFVGESRTATGYNGLFGFIFGNDNFTGVLTVTQYFSDDHYYDEKIIYFPERLMSVTVTDTKQLSYGAFYNCSFLKTIDLQSSISSVSPSCFYNCSKITELNLTYATTLSDNILYGCSALEYFEIGASVTSIGSNAFRGCNALSRINSDTDGEFIINNNVKSIGEAAFNGCSRIVSITLPFIGESNSATDYKGLFGYIFGSDQYGGSTKITQYYSAEKYYSEKPIYLPSSLISVTITNAAQVPYGAFYNCTGLTELAINASAKSNVDGEAFFNCIEPTYK